MMNDGKRAGVGSAGLQHALGVAEEDRAQQCHWLVRQISYERLREPQDLNRVLIKLMEKM